LILQHKLF